MATFYEKQTLDDEQKRFIIGRLQPLLKVNDMVHVRCRLYSSQYYSFFAGIKSWLLQELGEKLYFKDSVEVYRAEFQRSGIKNIELPRYIKTVEEYAFSYSSLEKIELNEGLEIIEEYSFRDTALKSIIIPSTVKRISAYSFQDCDNLNLVKFLGDSKIIISGWAFDERKDLKLYVPRDKVISWDSWNGEAPSDIQIIQY